MGAEPINIAIIGAGRIGQVHAQNLSRRLPQANLVAIADVFEEAARKAAQRFRIPRVVTDPAALLADPEIDAVAICSSTDTHAQFIMEAARAGKHIFCEKPIALDLARIDEALAAVEEAGVKLQIGFQRRFDPNFRGIREAVARGVVGAPYLVRITSRDPAPPPLSYIRVSGGLFLDMTIHDFDLARFLIGEEVEEVYTAGAVLVDPAIGEAGDVDTAVITMRYRNGALCVIDNCRRSAYGYDQRAEVLGADGAVTCENNTPHRVIEKTTEGVVSAKPLYFFLERYIDAYANEMRAFLEAVQKDAEPPVTGKDGRIPVVMGMAAWRSLREHRPVPLSEIEG